MTSIARLSADLLTFDNLERTLASYEKELNGTSGEEGDDIPEIGDVNRERYDFLMRETSRLRTLIKKHSGQTTLDKYK